MDKLNLQLRLGIILLLFFILAVVLQIARSTYVADMTIREEADSVSALVNQLFDISGVGEKQSLNAQASEADFLQRIVQLENSRHLDVRTQSIDSNYPQVNEDPRDAIDAPPWYIALVYPDEVLEIRTFVQDNGDIISIYSDPGDQVEAVWYETRARIIASFMFLILLMVTILFFTTLWMKPVEVIISALEKVEDGDFSRRIAWFSLPEFRRIGDHINHLTTRLGASRSENERLTRKSISVQEEERRHLAQELHDSLGQSVSAIKAIAVSIEDRTRITDPLVSDSVKYIEQVADAAYSSVRDLMVSLRPAILDELGLTQALNQMVDDWNLHHEDTFCRFRVEGDYMSLHEELQINIYRIVQEALTNISKYAKAENVSITLSGDEIISLLIVDDGKGFDMETVTRNMGLTGISDRVTLLRGELEIASRPGKGVLIQIEFPRVNYFRRRSGDR